MGAAARAEATEEIDFVPHILPCSSCFALGWHGTELQHKWTTVPCVLLSLRGEGGPTPVLSEDGDVDANMGRERDTDHFPVVLCNNSGTILNVTTLLGYKKSLWSR